VRGSLLPVGRDRQRPVSAAEGYSRPGVAGSGVVACGLAANVSTVGEIRLLARSDASAWRAEEEAQSAAAKLDGGDPDRIKVTIDPAELSDCDLLVEAIVEDLQAKADLLRDLAPLLAGADLATTTSSLRISELATMAGVDDRLFGLHVFNPVTKMELVELCFPDSVRTGARERARAWCEGLGKTPVEVPDQVGFVVNRLLFPYLFDAVRLMEETGMQAADVDACMSLGAGHPMGPLKLLDLIGTDVAVAIGEELYGDSNSPAHQPPQLLRALAADGKLGRKTGAGFYEYD
jgi:3-hydroxybutyryl-CoA dehydrogenase